MMRWYKYIIYRVYSWCLEKKDDTPGTTAELMMCLPHYFQILTVYTIIDHFSPTMVANLSDLQVVLLALGFQALFHIFIYNKKRWLNYIDEFKNETPAERKKGTCLLYIYTIGSITSLFICLPIAYC